MRPEPDDTIPDATMRCRGADAGLLGAYDSEAGGLNWPLRVCQGGGKRCCPITL